MVSGGTNGSPHPSLAVDAQAGATSVELWRRRMLDVVLWLAWVSVSVAFALTLREAFLSGRWRIFEFMAGAWLIVGVAAVFPRLAPRIRATALYVGVATASFGAVIHGAYRAPNPYLGLMMAIVLLALVSKPRGAWWALGVSALGLTAAAALFVRGVLPLPDQRLLDLRDVTNWLRVIAVFIGITGATLACVSYLTSKLESAMLHGQALLDALAAENRERLQAIERERMLSAQLQQAQKLEAVGTLAGGIAHDFNNVLLVILSHVELLRRKPPAVRELAESLEAIDESARRAAALTRKLLAFSRRQVVDYGVFELDSAIEASLGLIQRLLPSSIALHVTRAREPVFVRGAQIELDQVLMNLCLNARDAMPDGGKLEVTTSLTARPGAVGMTSGYACLTVRDDGAGIAPEQLARIFDPFFTTKAPDRGTGLGLSVVHGIVAKWGGLIEVSSEPGHGTELRVLLPCAVPDAPKAALEARASTRLSAGETVLFADDDPQVRAVMTAILSDAGYRVIACADGLEGLEAFHRTPDEIDLLVVDAVMPRMGGRELYEAVLLDRPDMPCLVCSGYAADTVTQDFFVPQRREFLQKPFSPEELLARVRVLLDTAKRNSAWREGLGAALVAQAAKLRT